MATQNELVSKLIPFSIGSPTIYFKELFVKKVLEKEGIKDNLILKKKGKKYPNDMNNFLYMPPHRFKAMKEHIGCAKIVEDKSEEEVMELIRNYINEIEGKIEEKVDEWVEDKMKDVYDLREADWQPIAHVLSQELIDKGYSKNDAENKVDEMAVGLLENHGCDHLVEWDLEGYIPIGGSDSKELEEISKDEGYDNTDDFLCEISNELAELIDNV